MKIVFTGTQGVGKTTLLDILEKCFSYNEPIRFVRNFTRDMVKRGLSINEDGTDETQLAIMQAHKDIVTSSDNIIMDRCMLDGIVYTTYLYRHGKVSDEVYKKCLDTFTRHVLDYDRIYYMVPEFPLTGDEFRSDKVQYQKDIADIFEDIIEGYALPVIKLTGTVGDRLAVVLKYLRQRGIIQC